MPRTISYKLLVLLLCLLLGISAYGQDRAYCDTLIARGKRALAEKNYPRSLELLTRARYLSEKNRWHEQYLFSTNNIGLTYYTMLDYGEALNYWAEGYAVAIKQDKPKHEMIMLNNIALLYAREENYDKAREYFNKAYETAREGKFYQDMAVYACNTGNIENLLNNPSQARKYAAEALPYMEKFKPAGVMRCHFIFAESDYLEGKIKEAREQAQEMYRQKDIVRQNNLRDALLELIAKCYIKEHDYPRAKASANELLTGGPDLNDKLIAFRLLADIYARERNIDSALLFKDSIIQAEKQLNDIKNGRLFENNRVKFEVQNYKKQIALKEEKLEAERKLFYLILVIVIAGVSILILILRQKKLLAEKNRQAVSLELEKEKNANLLLENAIKEKEVNAMLEQERLKNEIDARNRKLSAKALYLTNRNELIDEILTSIAKKPKISKDPVLVEQIRTLKNHLKAENEWESFIAHFEEVNHGFIERLKNLHPSLNQNDIRFVTYIYMNLTIKEISSILSITPDSCRKRKERVCTKLGIHDNISIYDYVSSI